MLGSHVTLEINEPLGKSSSAIRTDESGVGAVIFEQVFHQQVVVAELFSAAATFEQVDLSVRRVERIDAVVEASVVVVAGPARSHGQLRDVAVVLDVVKLQVVLPKLEGVAKLAANSAAVQNFRLRAQHRMNTDTFL